MFEGRHESGGLVSTSSYGEDDDIVFPDNEGDASDISEDGDDDSDDTEFFYKMESDPRGYCVIINNRQFDACAPGGVQLETREGTDVDRDNLKKVFEELGFLTKCYENLKCAEMMQTLFRMALEDHTPYDCFVCCILSHGALGSVYGTDGVAVDIKDLTSAVKPQVCPSLTGKPKLFFIQACQGNSTQSGFQYAQCDASPGTDDLIPNETDFLLSYSTVPGFKSYRDPITGSVFVRILTQCIRRFAATRHLLEILTRVNEVVNRERIQLKDAGVVKQTPAPFFTLRKVLFFHSALLSRSFEDKIRDLGVSMKSATRLSSSGAVSDCDSGGGRYAKKHDSKDCGSVTSAGDIDNAEGGSDTVSPRDISCKEKSIVFGFKKIQRLRALAKKAYRFTDYKLVVKTSDRLGAGTDAKVSVELIGQNNKSTGPQLLDRSETHKDPFESGYVDVFNLKRMPNVGVLRNLRVSHDNSGQGPAWHLESIEVTDLSTHTKYTFPCNGWLKKETLVRDLPCIKTALLMKTAPVKYEVTVHTGHEKGAGTDANVFITIYGIDSDTGKRPLTKSGRNLFERGQADRFEIEAIDQGKLTKIRIEHDNSGLGAAWLLDSVDITNKATGVKTSFPVKRWLKKDKEGDQTSVEVEAPNC